MQLADGSGKMFDRVAPYYDWLNFVLSLGQAQSWRRRMLAAVTPHIQPDSAAHFLDIATGTGDVALLLAKAYPHAQVVGIDPSPKMLALAAQKINHSKLQPRIALQAMHAEALSFAPASFDAVFCSFGLRNVHNRQLALQQMHRVTKPGGYLAILEFHQPESNTLVGKVAQIYLRWLVPCMGALLGRAAQYRYLQSSIAEFPPPMQVIQWLAEAGWHQPSCHIWHLRSLSLFVAKA